MAASSSGALRASGGRPLAGEALAPGDKSISHRALILGALAEGETIATGLLEADDVLRTAAAMRALGARIERDASEGGAVWKIRGVKWRSPDRTLYFGNSGTGCRLTMGACAGQGLAASFDGDKSLRRRPMERLAAPLRLMGAAVETHAGSLPARLAPARLRGVDYAPPAASAQVKSAILLAALGASGRTTVIEPAPSRDHTEKMLAAFGARLDIADRGTRRIAIDGGQRLNATHVNVPGDPSSAAFLIAAASITPGSDVLVRRVLVNPLRSGFIETLREMGAQIERQNPREMNGEPVADIRVRYSQLRGASVPPERAPSMIDEYPILAVVAAFAAGETTLRGIGELRVKESDRIASMEAGLNANGVETGSGPDWLAICGRAGDVAGGASVATNHDHRVAMSFLVMGLAAANPVAIDDSAMIGTSFPNFAAVLAGLGARIEAAR